MKAGSSILTREEIEVLLLVGKHPNGQHLSNIEIAQHLGISVSKVKILIHRACVKLQAHNRIEAMFFAVTRGEIKIEEIYTLDELAEIMSSLCPDVLTRIAHLVNGGLGNERLLWNDEEIGRKDRRQKSVLTKRERDVLALAGRGLTNKQIADTLYMCPGTVRTFLYRACTKLGACNRLDAIVLALKQGDVIISEVLSLDELLQNLPYLGPESLEKIAQLRSRNFAKERVATGS